jgi:type IV secretory pathway VirB10-like protein
MADRLPKPGIPEPGSVPTQPEAEETKRFNLKVVGGIAAVILVIGLANLHNSTKQTPIANSALTTKPASSNAAQVNSFQQQQRLLQQRDAEERQRQAVLAAQNAQLAEEQAVPGPESPNAAPMTQAQRDAMYGKGNPNAPQKTSAQSQREAEAKQRQLERERQHQQALDSDTVAIDFAKPTTTGNATSTAVEAASAEVPAGREQGEEVAQGPSGVNTRPTVRNVSESQPRKDPMAPYDFDGYQGRLYRVFEGTVLEGVVTNHIDGGLNGPMIVMLTTDYYSHDHQQLLLPQGTRLIGNVQSVSGAGQRKLFVAFNRAVCPDGFSLELNKYTGLDPLGTTGLATNVNNHYLSSFAAAAAVGGIGGLAQVGNSGSVLDSSTQIRNGISAQTAQESEQILNKFLNRLPVITVKEGSRARVYINQDILIPSYAEHRVDPSL